MRTRTAELVTVVLAVVGLVVSLTVLWPRLDEASPAPVEPGPSAMPVVPVVPAVPVGPAMPAVTAPDQPSRPVGRRTEAVPPRRAASEVARTVRVTVPTGGIDAPVRGVGVTADGQMALPADPEVLGWYRFGPTPGEGVGSAVLAGHLDSVRYGLGPLVGLREVQVGDPVRVTRADGTPMTYTVVDVRRYDRQALPVELFGRSGPERLRLITCGGEYLPDQGGYQENLVVTAVPS